jgi:HEAT repeat protein
LGKIGDASAVPALRVHSEQLDTARTALQPLNAQMTLEEAVQTLAQQGLWGVIIRALPAQSVREAVVQLGSAAVPALIQALGDADWNVRRAACEALGEIGDASAVPALIQALGDWAESVRRAACEALGEIGDASAVPALLQALGDKNEDVRRAACEALIQIGAPAVPALTQAISEWDADMRCAACWVLGEIGDFRAAPVLVHALKNMETRAAAHKAIVKLGEPAVAELVQGLGDWNAAVRLAVCGALGEIQSVQSVPALIQALGDVDRYVRSSACEALVKIGAPAVPELIRALCSSNWMVREGACKALGRIGQPQAIPGLQRRLLDEYCDPWSKRYPVREAAQDALQKIRDK